MKASLVALLLVALPAAASAQIEVIAGDSFDYPLGNLGINNGGTGWVNPWWSGALRDHAMVTAPGHDPIGNKVTTSVPNGGSYRLVDTAGLDKILDSSGNLGKDGTMLWLSFSTVRMPLNDDDYGGFSFHIQGVGERVFVGSPSGTTEWGIEDAQTGSPTLAPGTSCDLLAKLVCRVDFQAGADRVRLWVDPATPHPAAAPDVDVKVTDFWFNEVRLQSGNGSGGAGFDFDALAIESESFAPVMTIGNLVAGQQAGVDVVNCTPGSSVRIGYSLTGGGPTPSAYGLLALSPPVFQLPPVVADPNGEVHLTQLIPLAAQGRNVWAQCGEIVGPGKAYLSAGLALIVQ